MKPIRDKMLERSIEVCILYRRRTEGLVSSQRVSGRPVSKQVSPTVLNAEQASGRLYRAYAACREADPLTSAGRRTAFVDGDFAWRRRDMYHTMMLLLGMVEVSLRPICETKFKEFLIRRCVA